jgi:hypothetical protein
MPRDVAATWPRANAGSTGDDRIFALFLIEGF